MKPSYWRYFKRNYLWWILGGDAMILGFLYAPLVMGHVVEWIDIVIVWCGVFFLSIMIPVFSFFAWKNDRRPWSGHDDDSILF